MYNDYTHQAYFFQVRIKLWYSMQNHTVEVVCKSFQVAVQSR
jgi:hypothetical protein